MKILVTGSTGFIGNHIIDYLIKGGNEVIATSTNRNKASGNLWFSKVKYLEYSFADIEDEKNLFEYFYEPDSVIHLGWYGLPNYNGEVHVQRNLIPQYLFVKNLVKHGLRDLTITGTCLEYGMQNGCLREDGFTNPSTIYAIAKDSLRRMIDILNKDFDFSFKWARLFYMYGLGQNSNSLFPLLDKAIKNGDLEFDMSGGDQVRDYLSVETVAEFIVSIALQNKVNGIINCCSGKPITVKELVQKFILDRRSNIKINLGVYKYLDYEPMSFWGDNNKLNEIIGL